MAKKILIIDDEPDILKILQSMLKNDKYEVITAENGEEGYEKVVKEKPDLVLLDIMMPRMNGYEVCEKIKGNPETKKIPVVMLTVKAMGEDVEKALQKKADWYISKPFDDKYLLKKIRGFIGRA
jgi:CheY-like chemotaxis protein